MAATTGRLPLVFWVHGAERIAIAGDSAGDQIAAQFGALSGRRGRHAGGGRVGLAAAVVARCDPCRPGVLF